MQLIFRFVLLFNLAFHCCFGQLHLIGDSTVKKSLFSQEKDSTYNDTTTALKYPIKIESSNSFIEADIDELLVIKYSMDVTGKQLNFQWILPPLSNFDLVSRTKEYLFKEDVKTRNLILKLRPKKEGELTIYPILYTVDQIVYRSKIISVFVSDPNFK